MAETKDSLEHDEAAARGIGTRIADGAAQVGAHVSRAARSAVDTVESLARAARERGSRATRAAKTGAAAAGDAPRDVADEVLTRAAAGAEEIAEDIDDGIEDAADDLQDAADDGRAAWARAADAVREVSRDALAAAAERLVEAGGSVRDSVRARPLSALGLAGAAGFALALVLRKRR